MYIKEIRINGFKSFADKVNIELNRNFTGIVGPNGSGKSNVVDALKWVMGEQSVKTLRGNDSMTDVIFNGSSSREKSRSASVTVLLDNTDKSLPLDYSEIEIKRIVYKTGENEYFINKDKVRLKDITEMFMDSFSSKESLSIIPQGKIDEILGGKPSDRRVIFEDAAGVLKYKKRKEEALKKLEKTNENIDRIDMIITELSKELEPLEEQSKKARIYKENKDKLSNLEISVLAYDIKNTNLEYNINKETKKELENKLINITTSSTKDKTELENFKLKRTSLDDAITKLQTSLLEETDKLNSLSAKKELTKERSKYDKNNDKINTYLNDLKESSLKQKNEYESMKLKYESECERIDELKQKLDKNNTKINKITNEIKTYNEELNIKTRKLFELNSKKDILNYNIENMTKVPISVKSVLNNPSLEGIIGRVIDLIEIPNEYLTSIEVSLSSSSNYIVTLNDTYAKEAVMYLKRNKKGRATFYPLNLIKPRNINEEVLNLVKNEEGFISVASNLVSYDTKYSNIINNILGSTIIARNIDDSIKISKKVLSKYKVVSLEGDVINVGSSITGGSLNESFKSNEKTELDNVNKDIKILENEIETLKNTINESQKEEENTKSIISNMSLEILKLDSSNNDLYTKTNNLKIELDKILDEISSLSSSTKEEELDKILNEYYLVEQNKKLLETKIKDLEKTRKDLIIDIEETESNIRKTDEFTKDLQNKINDCNIKETKLNMNLDNLLNRLNEEYSMTYEKARNDYNIDIDINDARSIISDLKREIKSLGIVNLSSIDDYERINKRYVFLTTQRKDLEESENNLLSIIKEMDDVMIEKFTTTFEKVNIEFGKVFRELFNGGEAKLELTDPTNMLETGVEIIANPAGKNPGALSLLSGGEKTLTAISLLFAIMNLKSVPFVILDEVESALDDENVEKFGRYINSYKGKTQLLVITHKKKTMEFLDLLYGVTMQESGVSKLVSVKLEDISVK